VPCDGRAIIAGGLGGAGKSTVLGSQAGIDLSKYLIINPDDIKVEMAKRDLIPHVEGLSPMEASELVHEESSFIAKRLALRATADQKNIIWDITMSSLDSTERRIGDLRAAGYSVNGIFVDIPVETSVRRAEFRHRSGHEDYRAGVGEGGRYVPPEVIRAQADDDWGSKNRKTFEAVRPRFDQWSRYDNSVEFRPAILVEASPPEDDREETA
jgi:predicted ABC-type ATPase